MTIDNQLHYVKTIQSILGLYGICLKSGDRCQKNGIRSYSYSLSVDEQIKNIVEFKYGEAIEINFYKGLFKLKK